MSSKEGSSDDLVTADEDAPDITISQNFDTYFSSDEELVGAEEPGDAESDSDQNLDYPDVTENQNFDMYFSSDEEPGDAESDNDQEVHCPSRSILRSAENTINDIEGFSNLSVCVCNECALDLTASDEYIPDLTANDEYIPDLEASDEYIPDLEASDEYIPDPTASDEYIPDQTASDEYIPDPTASDEYIPDPTASDEYIPDLAASDEYIPGPTASDEYIPYPTASDEYIPDLTANDEYIPDLEASDEYIPDLKASDEYILTESDLDLTASDEYIPDLAVYNEYIPTESDLDLTASDEYIPDLTVYDEYIPELTVYDEYIPDLTANAEHIPDFEASDEYIPDLTAYDEYIHDLEVSDEYIPDPTTYNECSPGLTDSEDSSVLSLSDTDTPFARELEQECDAPIKEARVYKDESHNGGEMQMLPPKLRNVFPATFPVSEMEPDSDALMCEAPTKYESQPPPNLRNVFSDDESSDCGFLSFDEIEGSKPAKMRNFDKKKIAGANAMNDNKESSNLPAADLTLMECDNSDTSSVSEVELQCVGDVRGKDVSHNGGGMPTMPKLKLRSVDNTKVNQEVRYNTIDEPESAQKIQLPLLVPSSLVPSSPSMAEQIFPYDHMNDVRRRSMDKSVTSLPKPHQSCTNKVGWREKAREEIRDITEEGAVGGSRKQGFQLRKVQGQKELEKMPVTGLSESGCDETIDFNETFCWEINESFKSDEGSKAPKLRNIIRKKKAIIEGSASPQSASSQEIFSDENDCSKILENMRIKVEFQYIKEIEEMNTKIENIKQTNAENQERELKHLKSKQDLEKDYLVKESNHEKVKLERKKIELETQLAKTKKRMVEHEKQAMREKDGMDRRHKREAIVLKTKIKDETNEKEENLLKIRDELMKDMNNYANAASPDDVEKLESARGILECPICMELMRPPARIWMCPSNHLVCETCRDRLDGKLCPSCRTVRVNVRATVAENFAVALFKE